MDGNLICKIVFINYSPLTRKVYGDFFMPELQEAGFQVEYLDITALFHRPDAEELDLPIVRKAATYAELRQYLRSQDKASTLFIPQITFEWRVVRLYRLLTLERCLLGRFAINMNPMPQMPLAPALKRMLHITPAKLLNRGRAMLLPRLKQWGYIKPYDLIFNAGEYGRQTIGCGAEIDMAKGRVVQINSTDYNTYQSLGHEPSAGGAPYAVFLDEYLPLHPDFEFLGIATVDPERYYREINRFFDQIEQSHNITVIIAAHPKALKYHGENYFCGRQVIFGQTAALVRDSRFVLAHGSTACGFAAMFEKPITILSSAHIAEKMPWFHENYAHWAATFGAKFLAYDQPPPAVLHNPADHPRYRQYRYRFLTSPESENRKSIDILIDFLRKYPR